MRALLSDILPTVTNARINNIHKGLEIHGKTTQLVDPDTNPLMNQEALDTLMANSPKKKTITGTALSIPTLQPPLNPAPTIPQTASQIFAEVGISRDSKLPLTRRKTLYVQGGVAQTDEQQIGPDHSGCMRKEHVINLLQAFGAWIQGQLRETHRNIIPANHAYGNRDHRKRNFTQGTFYQDQKSLKRVQQAAKRWLNEIEMPCKLYWKYPIDVDCSSLWQAHAPPSLGVQEHSSIFIEAMDIDYLYILERISTVNSCGSTLFLWNLEPAAMENAYQCKGAIDGSLCSESQEFGGKIGVSLFRKYNHTLAHKEVRRHNLLRIIGDLRTDLVTLPENQNILPSIIRTVTSESSGCTEKTDGADRMVHISEDIRHPEYTIRYVHPIPKSIVSECTCIKMVRAQQPLLLLALEFDIPGGSESLPRTKQNGASYTDVDVSHLVFRSEVTVYISSDNSPSNDGNPRSQKLKISTLGKQALELDILEDQRRSLEKQDLGTYAIDFMMSKKIIFRHKSSLLAVTDFLRASKIHRIEDTRSRTEKGKLNLVIVAPKEKRGGQLIENICLITTNTDPILCPVLAYNIFKEKDTINL
ncbi:hypothetical protein AYI69_g2165 [Smittium culicis]|uniref:Uncharacterized protein n=1 Tax=Smittium culicis TaxID=133412 RepID=A0A1R1YN76_9FUNG|nr:hypothetical protein AYI69_g2165 [Smittium culicis]